MLEKKTQMYKTLSELKGLKIVVKEYIESVLIYVTKKKTEIKNSKTLKQIATDIGILGHQILQPPFINPLQGVWI
jgi:hypothetical protein